MNKNVFDLGLHLTQPLQLFRPAEHNEGDVYKRQYKNIDNNMNILHVHTKGRKLDTLEQLEIYKHMKTNKNDILNEQKQFKSHALFEHLSLIHI